MLDFIDSKYSFAIGRIMLAAIYFLGSFALFQSGLPIEYAASKGIPSALVYAAYVLKLVGGLAVIVGYQTRLAALSLMVFTVLTALIFHAPWAGGKTVIFMKELSMIGGLLILAAAGPGALSVDGAKK